MLWSLTPPLQFGPDIASFVARPWRVTAGEGEGTQQLSARESGWRQRARTFALSQLERAVDARQLSSSASANIIFAYIHRK